MPSSGHDQGQCPESRRDGEVEPVHPLLPRTRSAREGQVLLAAHSDSHRRRARLARCFGAAALALACACAAAVALVSQVGTPRTQTQQTQSAEDTRGTIELQLLGKADPLAATGLATPQPVFTPYGDFSPLGRGERWTSYGTAEEAFAALDVDGDGVLTYVGDHIPRLRNVTTGVPKGVFEMFFNSEKLHLLTQQNLKVPSAMGAVNRFHALAALPKKVKEEPRELKLAVGDAALLQRRVEELYTFGAPATAPMYLYDATRPMGCFVGLRTFSRGERYTVGFGVYFTISDPVAWVTSALNYDHAKMEALEATQQNDKENKIHSCGADYKSVVMNPSSDSFFWFSGHMVYEDVLKAHRDVLQVPGTTKARAMLSPRRVPAMLRTPEEKVNRAYNMSHWAFLNYHAHAQYLHLDAQDWGYKLVARSCSGREGFWAPRCNDHIALFQDQETLECVFAFEGSDDTLDWISDLDAFLDDFCGFGHVHQGFKFKLMTMVKSLDYRQAVLPKLPYCARVNVVGHSLGGAQAELFSACANKGVKEGEPGYEDYRYIVWEKGTPALLPAFFEEQVKGGVFLRNKANGFCMDVEGTMETKYEEDVMVYPCELPESNYSKDQRWKLTPDGLIVNLLTGFCVSTGVPTDDPESRTLKQWNCGIAQDQKFELTQEGFLKSKTTGLCVDSKLEMSRCQYSDQRWQLKADGHIENALSGMCLDVEGQPGTQDGDALVIWPCESFPGTDQLWTFSTDGTIRNTLSQKCVSFRNEQGRENEPHLVIDSCVEVSSAMRWEKTPQGFLRNERTGKCINVEGSPGIANGSKVTLARCEDRHLDAGGLWVHMEGGFLRNIGNDYEAQQRCLEVFGPLDTQKMTAGARLHLTGCEVNTDQRWELTDDGFIRGVLGSRKCLEARHDHSNSLWLQTCLHPADPSLYLEYKWTLTPEGFIKNSGSLQCFGVNLPASVGSADNKDAAAGAQITVGPCDPRHRWQTLSGGFVQHLETGFCLDVKGDPGVLDYSPLVLWGCERGAAAGLTATDQRWNFQKDGFLVNSLSAKCLQEADGKPNLVGCPTKQQRQQWGRHANGQLVNQHTGKCIDVERNETQSSIPTWSLITWDCNPARPEQQWAQILA